jgi:hypothetical protein
MPPIAAEQRPDHSDDYIVDPLPIVADESNVSLATLRREIRAGRGPVLTWLSQRRCGVQRRHRRAWLDSRSGASIAA